MNPKIKYAIITVIGIALFFLAYQALVAVPNKEREAMAQAQLIKMEEERRLARDKETKYYQCMELAYANYSDGWDGQCELAGKEPDCSLVSHQYKVIEERHVEAQDRCLALYK